MDMLAEDERAAKLHRFLEDFGWQDRSFIISALTGEGCKELSYAVIEHLEHTARPAEEPEEPEQQEPAEPEAEA